MLHEPRSRWRSSVGHGFYFRHMNCRLGDQLHFNLIDFKMGNLNRSACVLLLVAMLPFISSLSLSPLPGIIPGVVTGEGGFANSMCETNPTHLACNTSVAAGHMIIQHLPANAIIRPCSVFLASPHCCAQFCLPGAGGTCDMDTGACFCNPAGAPEVCQALVQTEDSPDMGSNDNAVLAICQEKCAKNPNGCTKGGAASDGIVGTVCMCYCDPA